MLNAVCRKYKGQATLVPDIKAHIALAGLTKRLAISAGFRKARRYAVADYIPIGRYYVQSELPKQIAEIMSYCYRNTIAKSKARNITA